MSAAEHLAGCFLEHQVVAERGVDHDPAHNEPEAPAPIEIVWLRQEAVHEAPHDERSENQKHPIHRIEMAGVEIGSGRRPVIPVGHREDGDQKRRQECQ